MAARLRVPRLLLAGLGQRDEEALPESPIAFTYLDSMGLQCDIEGAAGLYLYCSAPQLPLSTLIRLCLLSQDAI